VFSYVEAVGFFGVFKAPIWMLGSLKHGCNSHVVDETRGLDEFSEQITEIIAITSSHRLRSDVYAARC